MLLLWRSIRLLKEQLAFSLWGYQGLNQRIPYRSLFACFQSSPLSVAFVRPVFGSRRWTSQVLPSSPRLPPQLRLLLFVRLWGFAIFVWFLAGFLGSREIVPWLGFWCAGRKCFAKCLVSTVWRQIWAWEHHRFWDLSAQFWSCRKVSQAWHCWFWSQFHWRNQLLALFQFFWKFKSVYRSYAAHLLTIFACLKVHLGKFSSFVHCFIRIFAQREWSFLSRMRFGVCFLPLSQSEGSLERKKRWSVLSPW